MILSDMHVHTVFSDGKNTPHEIAEEAYARGMKMLGFSDHSHTFFDEECGMKTERIEEYKNCISELKDEYKGKMEIFCGIEQDFYSDFEAYGYDYIIGSTHYLHLGDEYVPVDYNAEKIINAAKKYFDGDIYAFIEEYYATEAMVCEKTKCDIIGHFDLISKMNEGGRLFDESSPRYIKASHAAADALLAYGKPFEINTGAISRGYRSFPYPSYELTEYIRSNGGRFLLSSDSHNKSSLLYLFDKYEYML